MTTDMNTNSPTSPILLMAQKDNTMAIVETSPISSIKKISPFRSVKKSSSVKKYPKADTIDAADLFKSNQ